MANEITVNMTLQFTKDNTVKSMTTSFKADVAGSNYEQGNQSIPTTAGGTAINLGTCGSVGWMMIRNLDGTNYVSLLNATSGTQFAKLKANEAVLLRVDPGVTAPAALANTAAVRVEKLIIEI